MLRFDSFIVIIFAATRYSIIQGRENYSSEGTIQGKDYSREETINNYEVLTAEAIQRRKVFKGGNYLGKYGSL